MDLSPICDHNPTNRSQTVVTDYSAVAFLPVIMIGAVVLGICGVCQYKKWKHEKKQVSSIRGGNSILTPTLPLVHFSQIAHLNNFYEILEDTRCSKHGKMVLLQQNGFDEVSMDLCFLEYVWILVLWKSHFSSPRLCLVTIGC